jgi:hypothetical protein
MKISTGCKITVSEERRNPLHISHIRDARLLNKKSTGANTIMSSIYAASSGPGDARPGIDGPRRFDRRAGGGNNHLDLRSPCLGRGAASDAIGGHSTQRQHIALATRTGYSAFAEYHGLCEERIGDQSKLRHSGMRHLAQARNPYSPSWLWIPGLRFAPPGMTN